MDQDRLNSQSLVFVEEIYSRFLKDPASVSQAWRDYFAAVPGSDRVGLPPRRIESETFAKTSKSARSSTGGNGSLTPRQASLETMQHRVDQLIRNYRVRGHIIAHLDPLGIARPQPAELNPQYYGFSYDDLDLPFSSETLGAKRLTLREILERLTNTYCRSIGVQFMHIDELNVREWLQFRMEGTQNRLPLTREQQLRILTRLTDAVIFEEFIQKKFRGAKSFSLEGAESLIPLLEMAIEKAGDQNVSEVVIAMAHRGRLNVLANIMGKSPAQIFREYEDKDPELHIGGGDVKYHLGYHRDWRCSNGANIHLALCFNPSHLEFVNPVALGRMRARQDREQDHAHERGLVVLIHGDAAFAGEGVVQETLNLSELEAYTIGGSIHVVVNNQIGFTTGPDQGRSSVYASDVAKMLQSPILHVNGEDPEAVAQVINLAMDFRREFKRDVVIDMYCYRRRGHNEGDEPSYTQPLLYKAIERRSSVRKGYLTNLRIMGGVSKQEAEKIAVNRREDLERHLDMVDGKVEEVRPQSGLRSVWSVYRGGRDRDVPDVDTGVSRERLVALIEALTTLPAGFQAHPKILRLLELRRAMGSDERPLDWAAAEALALASLATEGARIRLTGQDSERGTFSHRHAVLHDQESGERYMPLRRLAPEQAQVDIYNSPLSETAVLGFEYGFSLAYPDALVMWEAQFGDFCNAAQVIIDQFIVSAEDKWRSLSGLTLLLPHGFEGLGPEHSSARLERFMQLAAEDNIQVTQPTTPAQFFHLLRRQVVRPWRKPLVVMTPKSMLRHSRVTSTLDELTRGAFQRVIPDDLPGDREVSRVLLCSGKVYYDLLAEREKHSRDDVAIVRVEQLYPLQAKALRKALDGYADGTPVFWVQEEPGNMGAWLRLRQSFCRMLLGRFPFKGIHRPSSASPATGSASSHRLEQDRLMRRAFADNSKEEDGNDD